MIFRNLDSNGDWTFGQGKGNYLSGNPAIGLNIRTRLLSWVGDCFFDANAGVDWTNRLSLKNQKRILDAELRRIILQSYGVTGIVSFSTRLDDATRTYNATYEVTTIFSQSYVDSIKQEL